jgi:hypothetical protein
MQTTYRILSFSLLTFLSISACYAQQPLPEAKERTLLNDFQVDPNLSINKGPDEDRTAIEATIAIPSTDRKSFASKFDITIDKFYSYGKVWVGFRNAANGQGATIAFQKGDDGIARAFPVVSMGPGQITEVKAAEELKAGKYRVTFEYSVSNNSFRWTMQDESETLVYDSGFEKVGGRMAVDSFYIKVIENHDVDVSDIYYDSGTGSIFFRSQVGHEGGIPYVIEGGINQFSVIYK